MVAIFGFSDIHHFPMEETGHAKAILSKRFNPSL